MSQDTIPAQARAWYDSAHASLCLLGTYLRQTGFFLPLEERVQIQQKTIKYTPVQKLEMFFVSLLAGAKAVAHTNLTLRVDPALWRAFGLPGCADQAGNLTLRVDPALWRAFGLPGCADQAGIAHTLDPAPEADVSALREAVAETFRRY